VVKGTVGLFGKDYQHLVRQDWQPFVHLTMAII